MCYCDVKSRDFLLRDTSSERFCRLRDSGLRDMRSGGLFFAGRADGFRAVRRSVARLPGAMLPERGMSAVCVVWRREGSVPAVSGRGGEGRSDSAVGRVRASGCRFLA